MKLEEAKTIVNTATRLTDLNNLLEEIDKRPDRQIYFAQWEYNAHAGQSFYHFPYTCTKAEWRDFIIQLRDKEQQKLKEMGIE